MSVLWFLMGFFSIGSYQHILCLVPFLSWFATSDIMDVPFGSLEVKPESVFGHQSSSVLFHWLTTYFEDRWSTFSTRKVAPLLSRWNVLYGIHRPLICISLLGENMQKKMHFSYLNALSTQSSLMLLCRSCKMDVVSLKTILLYWHLL